MTATTTTAAPAAPDPRRLLRAVPADLRPRLAALFRDSAQGATSPSDLVDRALVQVRADLSFARRYRSMYERRPLYRLVDAIARDDTAALDFARVTLEERQRPAPAKTADDARALLGERPATARQVRFLRALGDDGPQPRTALEASERIAAAAKRAGRGREARR